MTYIVEYIKIAEQMNKCLAEPAQTETQREEEKGIKIQYEGFKEKTVSFPSEQAYVLWLLRWI